MVKSDRAGPGLRNRPAWRTTFGPQADRQGDHQMCEKRQDHAERVDQRRWTCAPRGAAAARQPPWRGTRGAGEIRV